MRVANVVNEVSETTVRVAVAAAVGGLAAAAVPILGVPIITGAVFCGTAALAGKVIEATIGKLFKLEGTTGLTHAVGRVFTVLAAAGVAAVAATLLGFPITLLGGLAILGVIAIADIIALLACKVVSSVGHWAIQQYDSRKHQAQTV